MPFTYYPKNSHNLICAWVQPAPPDEAPFNGQPRFALFNRFEKELQPEQIVSAYHDAQAFTRFYGSIASDQPLELTLSFSNEETAKDGQYITDDNIVDLNFDAEALKQAYDPSQQAQTGLYTSLVYGRYLRVDVKNIGYKPTGFMRVFVRGTVL